MSNDLFNQAPIGKPGKGKSLRPSLDPARDAAATSGVSVPRAATIAPTPEVDSRLSRLQLVSIDRLTASTFQGRDELNAVEDQEYQQLRASVEADLAALPEDALRTIEHVFVVMPVEEGSEQLMLASGGHRRLQVCHDLGVQEVYVWLKDFNKTELARGTVKENKGRKATHWLEDARTYKEIMSVLGWNQTQLAEHLDIRGGQVHVSRCLSILNYHPDLQRMIVLAEDRGMRAAKELDRLREHFGIDKARELWSPLIAGFLNGSIFTDDIEQKVKQLLGDPPEKPVKMEIAEFPGLRLQRQAVDVRKKWQSFRKEVGDGPLSTEVKQAIEDVYREMGEILARQS